MSMTALGRAWKQDGLTTAEKLILIALADSSNEERGEKAWPSLKFLSNKTGCTRQTVCRAAKKLESLGIFTINKLPNGGNEYQFDPGWLDGGGGVLSREQQVLSREQQGVVERATAPIVIPNDPLVIPNGHFDFSESKDTRIKVSEDIYALYPRKVGRASALKAILKALKTVPSARLKDRVTLYRDCVSRWPSDAKKFVPHPATWFNQGRYDDDPKEWKREGDIHNFPGGRPKWAIEKEEREELAELERTITTQDRDANNARWTRRCELRKKYGA